MQFFFYIEQRSYNDATSYYVDIIKKSIEEYLNEKVIVVYSIKEIKKEDIIFTIQYKTYYFAYRFAKCRKLYFWAQGILPEELGLLPNTIKNKLKINFYNRVEKLILRTASLIFFVSEDMRLHYQSKWGINVKNYIIMPCFNKKIDKKSFFVKDKYTSPSFVYAGSLSCWQCIDETLELYKIIETQLKNSSLTLLTAEKEKAKTLIAEKGLTSVIVNYVPLDDLDNELKKYKYAFLIRDNINVNNVATPTKMNTYLANGLIPIYSDVIGAFKRHLSEMRYSILLETPLNIISSAEKIVNFENNDMNSEEIFNEYNFIFNSFYNENQFKRVISDKIRSLL